MYILIISFISIFLIYVVVFAINIKEVLDNYFFNKEQLKNIEAEKRILRKFNWFFGLHLLESLQLLF